ncbi:histidinol-phosphate transaminase [Bosea sp. Tri-44]|uniref:histidinol-phosphate transaminase n=1 Tax=Bosea sp. Tri-44 TaxID=1972137 RepID=UPI0024A62D73|nr:histidinol-phosphate transaminase [Bosea sp. Tri-44]
MAALPAYNAGMNVDRAREISGRQDIARLASNENPDGCSPAVWAALTSPAFEPWRYADPACTLLKTALARKLAVGIDEIVIGNGSEEMIAAISRATLMPGAKVVTVAPSFGLHEIEPLAVGAQVVKVAMTAELGFDIPALEAAIVAGPRLVFLSSPWNPVGPALDRHALQRLIAATGPNTLFVLDEAYFEFGGSDMPDGLALMREAGVAHIILRTFSKAYGLAGLRVGYAVCSDAETARVVAAAKTPFNVNGAAQIAALAALDDEDWMLASVARLRAERQRVTEALRAIGLHTAPSHTNFVFLDAGRDSVELERRLLMQGILVKAWREPGFQNFVRATIGHRWENDRFLEALAP